MSAPSSRPSDSRRSLLKYQIQSPLISEHFPLPTYYALASKLLTLFHDSNESANLDESYVYAKRYCHLVFNVIPHHGYYNSKAFSSEKKLSTKSAMEVMGELEKIVAVMDVEEMVKREELERRLSEERERKLRMEEEMEEKRAEEDLMLPPPPSYDPSKAFNDEFPDPPKGRGASSLEPPTPTAPPEDEDDDQVRQRKEERRTGGWIEATATYRLALPKKSTLQLVASLLAYPVHQHN